MKTTYKITLASIKNLKALMNKTEELKSNYGGYYESDYFISYGEKTPLIEDAITKEEKETQIIFETLSAIDSRVDYNTVIDMAFDFEFAENILNQVYAA